MKNGKVGVEGVMTGRIKGDHLNEVNGPAERKDMLKVTSIFLSVDGEVNPMGQGVWSTFVRLSGCTAGCKFCFGIQPGRKKPKVILSEKPSKHIDKIEVGDKLMTFDSDMNLVETEVTAFHTREVDCWYRIKINGHLYFVTPEHPFFTTDGLVSAKDLKIGAKVLHSDSQSKLSFSKVGERNPNYQSPKIKRELSISKFIPPSIWDSLSPDQREKVKESFSFSNRGVRNGMYKGGPRYPHWTWLKDLCSRKIITECQDCNEHKKLEVHHIDENQENDSFDNLVLLCHSCHHQRHNKGLNFWKGKRKDGKELSIKKDLNFLKANGYEVEEIKYFDRSSYPPSTRPKPLKVYNMTCAPYDTYLVDYMWVHNCDTKYSWKDGDEWSVLRILAEIKDISQGVKKITITGGEPLESRGLALIDLIQELLLDGYYITIETNGLHEVDLLLRVAATMGRQHQLSMILDWKLPSAGKVSEKVMRNHYVDLPHNCFVKFVVSDCLDFERAIEAASFIRKVSDARIYFSPCAGGIEPAKLFEWMKDSICPSWGIGYNLQLHKYIFSDDWRDEEQ